MKKGIYINKLIYSIIVTLLLLYFYTKTSNGKIVLIPFLVCGIAVVLKNIFLLMNKEKYVRIFNKIFVVGFLLFWFGFLIYWCYVSLIDKEYSLLLFSIPFWIGGIFVVRNIFFRR